MESTPSISLTEEIIHGTSTADVDPSAPTSSKNSPTMGDPEIQSSEQIVDGAHYAETNAEDAEHSLKEEGEKLKGGDGNAADKDVVVGVVDDGGGVRILGGARKRGGFALSTVMEEHDEENEDPVEVGEEETLKPTKIVLRMLPPKLTRSDFIDYVSPLPEYNYLQVDNPDPEWGPFAHSVAHINFINHEDALWFIDRFTGYQFLDDNGDCFTGICDFAMSQLVHPPPKKENPFMGKLLESDEYIEFLKKYEENPFQFAMRRSEPVVTAEAMLLEIENKPNRHGPKPTPLTEFIRNQNERQANERQLRRDKERERRKKLREGPTPSDRKEIERERERKEIGEKHRDVDRDLRKEKKRIRRDKERKDRRERERMEKEAKSKGMIVTFSKTGKATRWSANSSPFLKKGNDETENMDDKKKSDSKAEITTTTTPAEATASSFKNENKDTTSERQTEADTTENKRPSNPFSKDYKKIEKPRDEKPKFGKPFPTKSDEQSAKKSQAPERNSTTGTGIVEGKFTKKIFSDLSTKEGKEEKPSNAQETKMTSQNQTETKGKTKIVKKIIRIRKVKGKTEEGDASVVATNIISKSSSSTSKKDDSISVPIAKSEVSNETKQKEPLPASSKVGEKEEGNGSRRRHARPDVQIYRPGSLRSNKDIKEKKPQPRDKPQTANPSPPTSTSSTKETSTTAHAENL